MSVNLNTCKPGDTLVRRDGRKREYGGKFIHAGSYSPYQHFTTDRRTYTDRGRYDLSFPMGHMDIVAIVPKPLDLSALQFGDIVECASGRNGVVVGVDNICKAGRVTLALDDRSLVDATFNGSRLGDPEEQVVTAIKFRHPKPKFDCTLTCEVEAASEVDASKIVTEKLGGTNPRITSMRRL